MTYRKSFFNICFPLTPARAPFFLMLQNLFKGPILGSSCFSPVQGDVCPGGAFASGRGGRDSLGTVTGPLEFWCFYPLVMGPGHQIQVRTLHCAHGPAAIHLGWGAHLGRGALCAVALRPLTENCVEPAVRHTSGMQL